MSYNINHTNPNLSGNTPIVVEDMTTNIQTNLSFPGRNQRGYSSTIAENFLRLLENFASGDAPNASVGGSPVTGQLWYNTDENDLKVYDGTTWKTSGSVKKKNTAPTDASVGDLWTNTTNNQLYLNAGTPGQNNWILVGPLSSSVNGTKNGSLPEVVLGNDINVTAYNVIKNYVDDKVVSIFSASAFTPKIKILGFDTINVGLNVSNITSSKIWGVAEKAERLIYNGTPVSSNVFMRNDSQNTTTQRIIIRNNDGVVIGSDGQTALKVNAGDGILYHSTPDSSFDIRLNIDTTETTVVHVDKRGRVGINNIDPQFTLDVLGNGKFSSSLSIGSTTNSSSTTIGALTVAGGVGIVKDLYLGGNSNISGNIVITSGTVSTSKTSGALQVTGGIGISGNVYADTFYGNFNGSVIGQVTGGVSGSATSLAASKTFSMIGDVITEQSYSFNGTNDVIFDTTIDSNFIKKQTTLTSIDDGDLILFYNNNSSNLRNATKKTLLQDIPVVHPGMIFPYAGPANNIPYGYLLCDGSEVSVGTYPDLYSLITSTYNVGTLAGSLTFKIPDLRGRFPMGNYNMDNDNPLFHSTAIDPNDLGRANDVTTKTLGNAGGVMQKTLSVSNMPDHTHTLKGSTTNQYYAIRDNPDSPIDTGATTGKGLSSSSQAQLLGNSGPVDSTTTGQSFSLLNPFLTINYIIYVGRIVA